MVQTPQQRKANEKFAKRQEKVMGKPESVVRKKNDEKSPLPKWAVILLIFAVAGSLVFELVRLVWSQFM